MRPAPLAIGLLLSLSSAREAGAAPSVEAMVGHQRTFFDVQFLEVLIPRPVLVSVFSRTRATVTYDNEADIFSGLYLSATSPWKLGLTLVGAVRPSGASGDLGIHFLHAGENLTLFALASAELRDALGGSLFVIGRYQCPLTEAWSLYASVEVYSLWRLEPGHIASVERLRLGLEVSGWAFGPALNLGQQGAEPSTSTNFGAFLRKRF